MAVSNDANKPEVSAAVAFARSPVGGGIGSVDINQLSLISSKIRDGIVIKTKFEDSMELGPTVFSKNLTLTVSFTHTMGEGNIVHTSTNGQPYEVSGQKKFGNYTFSYTSNNYQIKYNSGEKTYLLGVSNKGITSGVYENLPNNRSFGYSITNNPNWGNTALVAAGVAVIVTAPSTIPYVVRTLRQLRPLRPLPKYTPAY